jgi:hypothetical protein
MDDSDEELATQVSPLNGVSRSIVIIINVCTKGCGSQSPVREPHKEIALAIIDCSGDIILDFYDLNDIQQGSCLVSIKVLSLTSPVFARMVRPGFSEGEEVLAGDCPTIKVRGDEFPPMETILKALHYQGDMASTLTTEEIAGLATHADKYDCVKALGPWVSLWFENIQYGTDTSKELGLSILAAYLFHAGRQFVSISQKAMLQLVPDFASDWDQVDLLELLPSELPGEHINLVYLTQWELTYIGHYFRAHSKLTKANAKKTRVRGNTAPHNQKLLQDAESIMHRLWASAPNGGEKVPSLPQ